ncbi:hypothetical protein [Maridesulfovibrio sp.]|uniref:hypothetical protein n=1 Tax=Maridesulfovibrio sp. TaxID=2795000 RepID=UPI0039EF0301
MFKRFFLLMLILLLVPVGCAHKKPEITGVTNLPITPITTPTEFRFSSFPESKIVMQSYWAANKEKESVLIVGGKAKAQESTDKNELIWDLDVLSMNVNNKKIKSDIPILSILARSDLVGEITKIAFTSPALSREGKSLKSYTKFKTAMEHNISQYITTLRKAPVVSGDVLFYLNKSFLKGAKINKDIELQTGPKLLGYSYLDEKKVVVAQMNIFDMPVFSKVDHDLRLSIKAYYIFDAQNMQQIDGEAVCDLRDFTTGNQVKVEIKNYVQ